MGSSGNLPDSQEFSLSLSEVPRTCIEVPAAIELQATAEYVIHLNSSDISWVIINVP